MLLIPVDPFTDPACYVLQDRVHHHVTGRRHPGDVTALTNETTEQREVRQSARPEPVGWQQGRATVLTCSFQGVLMQYGWQD